MRGDGDEGRRTTRIRTSLLSRLLCDRRPRRLLCLPISACLLSQPPLLPLASPPPSLRAQSVPSSPCCSPWNGMALRCFVGLVVAPDAEKPPIQGKTRKETALTKQPAGTARTQHTATSPARTLHRTAAHRSAAQRSAARLTLPGAAGQRSSDHPTAATTSAVLAPPSAATVPAARLSSPDQTSAAGRRHSAKFNVVVVVARCPRQHGRCADAEGQRAVRQTEKGTGRARLQQRPQQRASNSRHSQPGRRRVPRRRLAHCRLLPTCHAL